MWAYGLVKSALQNLISRNLDLRMTALHSETILTSLSFVFTYYQDVTHEEFLMQKELAGLSVIDSLVLGYSSHDCF